MKADGARKKTSAFLQRGVAAIEFAFVFTVLLLVVYGIATFGAVLYIQQVVSRAAEDGARAVTMLPSKLLEDDPRIQEAVYASLAAALIAPSESNGNSADRLAWIKANTEVKVGIVGSDGQVTLSVVYDYSANRILPSLTISPWMPDDVVGRATAIQVSEESST